MFLMLNYKERTISFFQILNLSYNDLGRRSVEPVSTLATNSPSNALILMYGNRVNEESFNFIKSANNISFMSPARYGNIYA